MDYHITYRKKDKAWQAIISYKIKGKWKQKSRQGFKTQKDAKPFIKSTVKKLESLDNVVKISESYGEYTFKEVREMYLEHSKLYKEHNTIKGYKGCFSNFAKLDDNKINEITKLEIQSIVDNLVKKELERSSIETYLRRLKTFFRYVEEDLRLITESPAQDIQIPKEKKKTDKKALTKGELNKLMNKLKDNKFYIVAYIATNTGMRLGEILGLTWNDISFKTATINVDKQWKILKETGKQGFGVLKSKNSYRELPMSKKFINGLRKYKKTAITDINNRVAPFNSSSISKYLNPKLKEFAGITVHELRHTYAVQLIANGVDFKTVALLLGDDVEQVMHTYSHVIEDMMDKAKKIINIIF